MAFICYIDESGDEGINCGGSRWFTVGALVVHDPIQEQTCSMVTRIRNKFNLREDQPLHWRDIKKHDKKLHVCKELLTEKWLYILIATDTTHPYIVEATGLKQKYAMYFYSVRLLLERLTWYARDNGNEKVVPIFEYRSNISYKAMTDYLSSLFEGIPETQISWNNLDWKNFKIMQKRQSLLLQASDCVCGAANDGLEYSELGFIEPRYILNLCERFYRRGGNLFSYGFKFLHADDNELLNLKKEYEWLNQMEAKRKSEGSHSS
jgi:hypothetical protein